MEFTDYEFTDGVRMSWNLLPYNKSQAERMVMPVGILYSPLREIEEMEFLGSQPIKCSNCFAVLNPWVSLDDKTRSFSCNFCLGRNSLPSHYADYLQQGHLLPETVPEASTLEYLLTEETKNIGYLFLIDKCMEEQELDSIKEAIVKAVENLPDEVNVGLVSFDQNIMIHDLSNKTFLAEKALNGGKDYTYEMLAHLLGFSLPTGGTGMGKNHSPSPGLRRFIQPLSECREVFGRVVENLMIDKSFSQSGCRAQRASGNALRTAVALGKGWFQDGLQIMMCTAGPCTYGAGKITPIEKVVQLRSHVDLEKDQMKIDMCEAATKFYDGLSKECIISNISVCLFAFTCDQFGFFEMKNLIKSSGGFAATHEEFDESVFRDSFAQFFKPATDGWINKGFGTRVEISMSKGMKVRGALGACKSLGFKNKSVSDSAVGEGLTCSWYLGTIDPNSTIAFVLENEEEEKNTYQKKPIFFQMRTYYKHSTGQMRLRVTTMQRHFGSTKKLDYQYNFDQEAAIALTARIAMDLSEKIDPREVMKWLDKKLIKFYHKFGKFQKGNISSFQIGDEMNIVPQFFYYLRKSNFVLTFGVSVDEHAFYKMIFIRENCGNSLTMIQPSLMMYNMENEADGGEPALCDIQTLSDDNIILFDNYLNVVIWHGETIAEWRNQGFQNQEGYEGFANLIQIPPQDAKLSMEDRFPVPKLTICDQGHGDERLIKSKLNPGDTDLELGNSTQESGNYITDDKSLRYFMDFLLKVVVNREIS